MIAELRHAGREIGVGEQPGTAVARTIAGRGKLRDLAAGALRPCARQQFARVLVQVRQHGRRLADAGDAGLIVHAFQRPQIQPQVIERQLRGLVRLLGLRQVGACGRADLLADRRMLAPAQLRLLDRRRIRIQNLPGPDAHGGGVFLAAGSARHRRQFARWRARHLARRAGGVIAAFRIIQYVVNAILADLVDLAGSVAVAQRRTQIEVQAGAADGAAATDRGLAQQVEIDPVLAAFEIQVDAAAGGPGEGAGVCEQRILRRDLPAHDHHLFPFTCQRLRTTSGQLARGLQEAILVAPDEEHLEQFQLQLAPIGLARDRNLHQVGGLIVQAIGHVEIRFRQRIALVEGHRLLAGDGVIDGDVMAGCRGQTGIGNRREAWLLVSAGFLDPVGHLRTRRGQRTDRYRIVGAQAVIGRGLE